LYCPQNKWPFWDQVFFSQLALFKSYLNSSDW